jgi:hypothetical protein
VVGWGEAYERLDRIVVKGEVHQRILTPSCFDGFVASHAEWSTDKSFVIFHDHPELKFKPHAYVERVQHSGLCYMHAPIVMQHYLVAMNCDEHIPMLDIAMFMRGYMSASALSNHIWEDGGGNSCEFLRNILSPESDLTLTTYRDEELVHNIRSFGPGLISLFEVSSEFRDSLQWQYVGTEQAHSRVAGHHAMLIVGYRALANGNS